MIYAVCIAVNAWAVEFNMAIAAGIAGGMAGVVFLTSLIAPQKTSPKAR